MSDLVTFETTLDDWKTSGYYLMRVFRDSEENTDFHANFIVITTHEINLVATTLEVKEHQVANILKKPAKENQLNEILKKYVWNEHGD